MTNDSGEVQPAGLLKDLKERDDLHDELSYQLFRTELDTFLSKRARIRNIAISGSYGSGKSSLIRTYFNQNDQLKPIQISFASFNSVEPDVDSTNKGDDKNTANSVDNNYSYSRKSLKSGDVEQSILRHILYSASPDTIPGSKYSRIRAIKKQDLTKVLNCLLFLVVFTLLVLYPTSFFEFWLSTEITEKAKQYVRVDEFPVVFHFAKALGILLIISITYPYLNRIFWYLSNIDITARFSSKGAEISARKLTGNDFSFLNQHLDELLYFFEMNTDRRIVVFEDLDRLPDHSIFIELRDINSLLNSYENIKGDIVFIYAVRDDLFEGSARVKFFDAIIPVVPFIDNSNSGELLVKALTSEAESTVSEHVCYGISYFIDDPRLLNNVVGEFNYYQELLAHDSKANLDKLFALIVYKNLNAKDFMYLQQGKGQLWKLLQLLDIEMRELLVQSKKAEIEGINSRLEQSAATFINDFSQARKLLLFDIIHTSNLTFTAFRFEQDGPQVRILKLPNSESDFNRFMEADTLFYGNSSSTNVAHYGWKERENYKAYLQLVEQISDKSDSRSRALHEKILTLENEITGIKNLTIADVAKQQINLLNQKSLIWKQYGVVRYLVLNKLIDVDYRNYISTFHEGSKTHYDLDLLRAIHSSISLDPQFHIDNPSTILRELKARDFQEIGVWNYLLLDELIRNFNERIDAVQVLFETFEQWRDAEMFVSDYLGRKKLPENIYSCIGQCWLGFSSWVLGADLSDDRKAKIIFDYLAGVELTVLENVESDSDLAKYISEFKQFPLPEYSLTEHQITSILTSLKITFTNLDVSQTEPQVLDIIIKGGHYPLKSSPILPLLAYEIEKTGLDTAPTHNAILTAARNLPSESQLRLTIEENLLEFVENVVLTAKNNTEESSETLVYLSNQPILQEHLNSLYATTTNQVKLISDCDVDAWEALFENDCVAASWVNVFEYMDKYALDDVMPGLSIYLCNSMNVLSKTNISTNNKYAESISKLIITDTENLDDNGYIKLLNIIPYLYNELTELTELTEKRVTALIDARKLKLTKNNVSLLQQRKDDSAIDLLTSCKSMPEEVLAILDERSKAGLLTSRDYSHINQRKIYEGLDETQLNDAGLATAILDYVDRKNLTPATNFVTLLFRATGLVDLRVSLLNKVMDDLSKDEIVEIFDLFSSPYSELLTNKKYTKLNSSTNNVKLVHSLVKRGWLSPKSGVRKELLGEVLRTYPIRKQIVKR